ncbi:MAG: phosphoglucosamine mutase [Candidatus Marinimicrobia bacterium]|nr:phosphoglucosamine mutase [Candidatus Neomarinimicrobiota bacterium]MBT4155603.1 phosphoglucosamine mutase [Candidatus Neomarinimicrobiota bacterium]MBT4554100.1 phosphoglucosamine mutase [Candidatus Neomarinimicrobiota bacterium]MBT5114846.1 phosphoglucosamine mutase [Candidatus Neomarinimicrobiota bacterium]MBT6413128.1 phosphoglucosamine mutase [Candidatus Neomarinimicrobiota bacterium]
MLIRSISGVRGLTDTHLTPQSSIAYAKALHQFLPDGVIMVGRDSRPSGEDIIHAMMGELTRLGRTVILCGIVPTPTVQFMVHNTEAVGGFIVTASHNPIEWNGLKFVREDSTFFHPKDCERLFEMADENSEIPNAKESGIIWPEQNAIQKHVIACASLKCINLNRIQRRHFKIVIDAVNGAGAIALPAMLESLGCEVIEINCEPDGNFTRGTEPLPENLTDLSQAVTSHNADVGFAVDPDADRLAVVNEKGEPLGEEYTLVLAADGYLKDTGKNENFVVNLSTSMALEKLTESKNSSVTRSAVGEINVVNKMNEIGSDLGGEGNGGVILRECHLGRDSLVAVSMVLNRMSQTEQSLSEIHQSLPQFEIVKNKVSLDGINPDAFIEKVSSLFDDADKNTLDGVKFTWEDRWVHLRKSNTEPIMRIYAEAPTKNGAEKLVIKIQSCL